jgi:membrane protein DedA with SNARE-associated domain
LIASAIARSARFFIVAGLIYFFGPPIKKFIDKYFNLLAILFVILLVGGFVLIKYALH